MQRGALSQVQQLTQISRPWGLQHLRGLLGIGVDRVGPVFFGIGFGKLRKQRQHILAPLPQGGQRDAHRGKAKKQIGPERRLTARSPFGAIANGNDTQIAARALRLV